MGFLDGPDQVLDPCWSLRSFLPKALGLVHRESFVELFNWKAHS